ncbi:MAG: TSUP family transporter [Promethearchaeota archaeon]
MPILQILLVIFIIAWFLNFLDAVLGMGYGTTLAIILFLFNFEPDEIILPILISGIVGGFITSICNILFKNIDLKSKKSVELINIEIREPETEVDENIHFLIQRKKLSEDTKIVIIFSTCGVISAIIGAFLTTIMHDNFVFNTTLKIYVGCLVLMLGMITRFLKNKNFAFSLKKVAFIGLAAGLNKSISGGGFGPITMVGQMMIGREGKKTVSSTALSEAIISISGIITFIITGVLIQNYNMDLSLLPPLTLGSLLSSPFASYTTRKIKKDKLKKYISFTMVGLGLTLIIRTILVITIE